MLHKIASLAMISFIALLMVTPATRAQQPASQPQQAITPAAPPAMATPKMRAAGPDTDLSYRIGPGDILDIRVFGRPEMTKDVRVDNFGRIRLPFLAEMQAACLTEAQLATIIADKYKKYLRDPQVDVMVKEFRSQPVAVIGAVSTPGRFQLQRRIRLLELLTFAGGPNNHAGSTVHIIHSDDHDYCTPDESLKDAKTKPAAEAAAADANTEENADSVAPFLSSIKLKDVLNGLSNANPYVQPGDIISIPE